MAGRFNKTIEPEVLDVLKRSTIDGTSLKLPEQLDRTLYTKVDKVIKMAGGKWNRGAGAHLFPKDVRELFGLVLETGTITDKKVQFQQFFTPPELADRMVGRLKAYLGHYFGVSIFLEPSCGNGSLVSALLRAGVKNHAIMALEIDPEVVDPNLGDVNIGDFMAYPFAGGFDGIVMNPPFTGGQDIAHVTRALELLRPGGVLVALMSPHFTFADNAKATRFRVLLEDLNAEVEEVAAGTFKESGTDIRTIMVTVSK